MEQRLDKITSALAAFQQAVLGPDAHEKGKAADEAVNSNLTGNVVVAGESETTIYKNAVDPSVVSKAVDDEVILKLRTDVENVQLGKRISSSSEEGAIDTSDEMIDMHLSDPRISGAPGCPGGQ